MPIIAQAPGIVAYSAAANADAITVSGTGTSAKIFPLKTAPSTFSATLAETLQIPGSGRLEGKRFRVMASGMLTTGASGTPTVVFSLYKGTSQTAGSNTLFVASIASPATANATSYPWYFDVQMIGDSISGAVGGVASAAVGIASSTLTVAAATPLASANFATEPVLNLCVGVTFSASAAGNLAQLDSFYCYAD